MQIAAGIVRERLKKLLRQPKTKRGRNVLQLVGFRDGLLMISSQATPNEVRPIAEINHAPCKAFVHWDERLTSKWIARIEPGAVTPDTLLVA